MDQHKKINALELRIAELEALYRNSSTHRDLLARSLAIQEELTEQARDLVARLWDEIAMCPAIQWHNPFLAEAWEEGEISAGHPANT